MAISDNLNNEKFAFFPLHNIINVVVNIPLSQLVALNL